MTGGADVKTRCTSCGTGLGPNVNFCGHCGAPVEHPADPNSTMMPPAPPHQGSTVGSTNVLAVASLVSGLVWFAGLGSIIAIFLGIRAKQEIRESKGLQAGEGVATAGITLGWIGIGVTLLLAIGLIAAGSNVASSGSIDAFDRVEFRLNMDSALEDAARAEGDYAQEHDGEYTEDIPATTWTGVSLTVVEAGPEGFCIEATHDTLSETRYVSSQATRPRRGTCN